MRLMDATPGNVLERRRTAPTQEIVIVVVDEVDGTKVTYRRDGGSEQHVMDAPDSEADVWRLTNAEAPGRA